MPTGIYQHKKGYKRPPFSKECIRNMKKAQKGRIPWNKGKKETRKEVLQRMKAVCVGRKPTLGKHWKVKDTSKMKGRKGKMSGMWKDGRCQDKEYLNWIKNKRNRDKRSSEGSHTWGEWEDLKAKYGYTCPCCKKREPMITLTEDHIIPLSKGGSDNIENIQPLCKVCNSIKHTEIIKYRR